ncbi:unnamed protein product [Mytilus coruscus]|uniref:Uncharacterized protein n=1 Tax=Mytilus coruscus TaxID=42192 RepID=A0A6J8A0E8_MYTCO|nr:unnamed protein product [Mytilus coruscus]
MDGGAMIGDIDMRGHSIVNLPAPAAADQPVTKGWYAQSWQDLAMAMQGKIDVLEEKVRSYHTTDRSKRALANEDMVESTRDAIEALEMKINSYHACNEDLSVTFKGVNGTIEYFPVNTMNASCDIKPVPDHEGNFKISKECLSTQNFSLERTMQIAVYDQNEEEKISTTPAPTTTAPTTAPTQNPPPKQQPSPTPTQQPSPTPTQQPSPTKAPTQKPSPTTAPATTPPLISGGHHIFEITCLPLETEGVERIALAETGITDIEQLHNV